MNQTGISKSNHQIFFQLSSFLTQGTSLLYALQIVLTNKYIVPKKATAPRIPQYSELSPSGSFAKFELNTGNEEQQIFVNAINVTKSKNSFFIKQRKMKSYVKHNKREKVSVAGL